MPFRRPFTTSEISSSPPPPCSSVLRPSSLAAVTILVWSTSENCISVAHSRTRCLTSTTSDGFLMGTISVFSTVPLIAVSIEFDCLPQVFHPRLNVQRGVNAGQRHAQFHQGDGDCRLHP